MSLSQQGAQPRAAALGAFRPTKVLAPAKLGQTDTLVPSKGFTPRKKVPPR